MLREQPKEIAKKDKKKKSYSLTILSSPCFHRTGASGDPWVVLGEFLLALSPWWGWGGDGGRGGSQPPWMELASLPSRERALFRLKVSSIMGNELTAE